MKASLLDQVTPLIVIGFLFCAASGLNAANSINETNVPFPIGYLQGHHDSTFPDRIKSPKEKLVAARDRMYSVRGAASAGASASGPKASGQKEEQ
jgi:hypothetical protein